MRRCRYIDVFFILAAGVSLCLFISLRIVVKEIFVDRLNLWHPSFEYILFDLNTTIDMSEGEHISQTGIEKYVEKYKQKLNAYTTSAMIFNQNINMVVEYVNKRLADIPTAYSAMRYVSSPSENVIDFSSYLEERGIPFLYVSAPCYESILCREGNLRLQDNCNSERSWFLLQNLKEAGVKTVDLADELAEAQLKDYDVSKHWFPVCALYSAEILSERLNQYGFEFNPSLFHQDNAEDYFQDKEEWRKLIYDNAGYEYSFPIPVCTKDMRFRLEHEGEVLEGSFEDVFLQPPDEYMAYAYHGFSVVSNSTLYCYYNQDAGDNAGKRILIIGDSFNWILADYLSVDIENIDVIYNATFTSSIRKYIEETSPDIVLMVYNDVELAEANTAEAFRMD